VTVVAGMRNTFAPLALAGAAGVLALAACGGPAQQGKVTGWSYQPPSVQSVDVSCSWWSASGSGSSYGSSSGRYAGSSFSGSSSNYCLDWNTADEPKPQVCTLKLSTGAAVRLDLPEQACRGYLGQQYPPAGGDLAGND
jgi:hypothetical protein